MGYKVELKKLQDHEISQQLAHLKERDRLRGEAEPELGRELRMEEEQVSSIIKRALIKI